ncbi:hypothetical protein ACGFZS_38280 [Streptomyces sp. NPDC048288]|uniref:hypothetical protein n=1 Tax=Streptomyces sp. NPDC048288 TaxID=3365529 RepID=UPI00371C2F0D
MNNVFSFADFLEVLPEGNFTGQGSRAFRVSSPQATFVPPNLEVLDSSNSPLITLISARGATGKSCLAKQVSALKKVPLWLLNEDMAVSGDALQARLRDYTGKSDGLSLLTETPGSFILVDALDEARMRVSGASWYEYVQTLFAASEKSHSLVLFGRERVLEDIWANFPGSSANWYEISHFDSDQRTKYIDLYVGEAQPKENETYIDARDTVIKALSGAVEGSQADSFIGYAPVLYAVALLLQKGNLLKIRNSFLPEMGNERRIRVLGEIIEQLLKREQEKTQKLAQQLGVASSKMYTPVEQIDWLAHYLLNAEAPDLSWCPDALKGEYKGKIREFIDDHPFRSESRWANPVFSAYIAAERFDRIEVRERLQDVGLSTGLLFEFISAKEDDIVVDEWQFAALHASLMASERHDVEVSVSVSGGEPTAETESAREVLQMWGELTLWESSGSRNNVRVDVLLDKEGVVDLKGPLASLSLTFPGVVTVRPNSGSANFGPDCFIRCKDLRVSGDSVQISLRPNGTVGTLQDGGASVTFELTGNLLCEAQLAGDPPVESFEVLVPEGRRIGYPWFPYQKSMELPSVEPNERATRFVKMMMNLLRNHGHKGTPAVFDKKLEGRQSIKGDEFRRVISVLQKQGVISLDGPMIHLTQQWMPNRFSGKKREGVQTFEDKREVWIPIVEAIAEAMRR